MNITANSIHGAAPLSESIITAIARLVDDSQEESHRQPTHYDIGFLINKERLTEADPHKQGQTVGKRKRVQAVLTWAYQNNPPAGERLVAGLIATIQGLGGFRQDSPNFVGVDEIKNSTLAFEAAGYTLGTDGDLRATVLHNLSTADLTTVLDSYVKRAQRGVLDAALLTGTGKDLLEAVAAQVLVVRCGQYPQTTFPGLLGQAFVALDMATPQDPVKPTEPAHRRLERALYELGCAVNHLRNKEGTGHGRPFAPHLSAGQARAAVEAMGLVAMYMLDRLK